MNTVTSTETIHGPIAEQYQVQQRALQALKQRLLENKDYSEQEIKEIELKQTSVFRPGYVLRKEQAEQFRALANLAQVSLKPGREIRSHRKYVGRLIVLAKRLSLPFVKFHIDPTLEGLNEQSHRLVQLLAEQCERIDSLEKQLAALEGKIEQTSKPAKNH